MVKLLIVRHGQTLWNEQYRVCGRTDIGLTEEGKKQAERLTQKVQDYDLELIISSPLGRACETAKIISQRCNTPIIVDDRLIEQDYGIYEGVDGRSEAFLENKRNVAYKYPNGESMMQVAYRIYGFLDEMKRKYDGKTVLLVSHGGVCRIIKTYFDDMTNDEFFRYNLGNAEMEEYYL